MRAIVQRVSGSNVKVDGIIKGEIGKGLLVLLAIAPTDNEKTIKWMADKLSNLRIFSDEEGKMNLSILQTGGDILIISNFTLYGDVSRGFRPSFSSSATPEIAKPMFSKMIDYMRTNLPFKVETGEFGADMDVFLVNDGPVTIIIDSKE
jgi:D-aminoacyl-tRNA deacylase